MPDLYIADTSCLIVLSKINRLDLLQLLFNQVHITPEIVNEFGEFLPEWIKINEVIDDKKQAILELDLDKGEASVIALALEHFASTLLLDEKKGRRIAKELGLKMIGTIGILILAKEKGIIASLKDEIERLQSVGFRISPLLIDDILNKYDLK